jgi:hypothetical protein
MPLTERQASLLEQMRADNLRAGAPYVPTGFWNHEARQFEVVFDATGINAVENEYFNTRFSGTQPNDPRLYSWFLWTYYNLVRQRDTLGLLDRIQATLPAESGAVALTAAGVDIPPSRLQVLKGKPMSPDLLFSVDDFYNLCELDPRVATEEVVVADLGAGWGRLGYVLLRANPRAHYVILDIPETLLVANERLPRVLADASVGDYAATRAINLFERDTLLTKNLWILGCHDLARFATSSIDVVANIASFQEMPANQVNAYLGIFDQAALGGSVYLRNNWAGVQSSYTELAVPEGWERVFLRNARASCDYYEAGLRVC